MANEARSRTIEVLVILRIASDGLDSSRAIEAISGFGEVGGEPPGG
jgi:hypothetical protein